MTKKSEQLTLDELRDKSVKSKTKLSFGKEIGGYSKKQVTEYIDNLTEDLRNAEESFNSRLEEYTAMITMLKQERDQYGEMYNLCKSSKIEMSNQIDELKKENDELNQLINELSGKKIQLQLEPSDIDLREHSIESQKKLDEYLSYEQESKEMKAQLDQLKSMVRDLNSELENYAKENLTGYDSGSALVAKTQEENDVLKSQYDDILRERGALLTEKNRLAEENIKLSQETFILNEQLRTANQNCDERIQKLTAAYESNADEFEKSYQKTLTQLTENMKSSLILINAEGDELSNFMKKARIAENNPEQ